MDNIFFFIRFSETVAFERIQQFSSSLHGALQRNSSGEVSEITGEQREIITTITGNTDSAYDVIMAYLKFKGLVNDATVSFCLAKGKRETQLHPKILRKRDDKKLDKMMAKLKQVPSRLRSTLRPPVIDDIVRVQQELGIAFHKDYVKFQLEVSAITYGTREPFVIGATGDASSYRDFSNAFRETRDWDIFPQDLFPICESNGDFFCMKTNGKSPTVYFWSHGVVSDETWPDLGSWIDEEWIGDGDE